MSAIASFCRDMLMRLILIQNIEICHPPFEALRPELRQPVV